MNLTNDLALTLDLPFHLLFHLLFHLKKDIKIILQIYILIMHKSRNLEPRNLEPRNLEPRNLEPRNTSHIPEEILQDFPKFELSYETMIHKKVHDSDMIYAIPDGPKFLAWFTVYNDENVCFILDANNKTKNIQIAVTSFNDHLVYGQGTVFYGTIFKYNEVSCFCIENMYYYKGLCITDYNYLNKMQVVKTCLQNDLSSNALTNKFTIFGLPIMNTNFNALLRDIDLLPYKISQIQFRFKNARKILAVKYFKPRTNIHDTNIHDTNIHDTGTKSKNNIGTKEKGNIVFKVSPQIQTDIYNLFVLNEDLKDEFYDIAFIPDLKTSVLMNKLFRNIKENQNLDALEESDDEAEFENEKEDKFVFLDRSFKMNCHYNYKFKKWVPLSVAARDSRVISSNKL